MEEFRLHPQNIWTTLV